MEDRVKKEMELVREKVEGENERVREIVEGEGRLNEEKKKDKEPYMDAVLELKKRKKRLENVKQNLERGRGGVIV